MWHTWQISMQIVLQGASYLKWLALLTIAPPNRKEFKDAQLFKKPHLSFDCRSLWRKIIASEREAEAFQAVRLFPALNTTWQQPGAPEIPNSHHLVGRLPIGVTKWGSSLVISFTGGKVDLLPSYCFLLKGRRLAGLCSDWAAVFHTWGKKKSLTNVCWAATTNWFKKTTQNLT